MKCILLSENLKKAIGIVERLVSQRQELPILDNVLLETKSGLLHLTTTNLETGITTSIGGKVEKEGAITVSAHLFSEFVRNLKTGKVTLEVDKTTLFISNDESQGSFTTIGATEFPTFPLEEKQAFSLSYADYQLIARHVVFAASTDEGRPVLTGLKIKPLEINSQGEPLDNAYIVAATDGFRLSVQKLAKFSSPVDSIIPAKTFAEGAKIAQELSAEKISVSFAKNKNQLIFSFPDTQFYSTLIEGEFPDFARIIPVTSTTQVIVNKELFLRSIKLAAIFARQSANIIRIAIKTGKLTISANTPQIGEEKSEIEATITGEDNEVAFNFRFLLEFLQSVEAEEIYFQMTTPLAPVLFRPHKDTAYTHVIMPVRVQSSENTK